MNCQACNKKLSRMKANSIYDALVCDRTGCHKLAEPQGYINRDEKKVRGRHNVWHFGVIIGSHR